MRQSADRAIANNRSGELNAKNRELLALQAQARARLAKTRANFADGVRAAKETQKDLEWTQKKVRSVACSPLPCARVTICNNH